MEKEEIVRYKVPIIEKEKLWTEGNLFFIILIGILLSAITLITILDFNLKGNIEVLFIILMSIFYLVVIIFTLEPSIVKEVTIKDIQEKEVIKEVPKQIIQEVDKTIYVTNPRKKRDIQKYKFVGSTETKRYHKKNCRLAKLIKNKYKVLGNSEIYFKSKGYKPCKICLAKNKSKE